MATYTTYDEVGVKEDVSDVITNISPRKTPFVQSLKTEKVHQRTHQWQEDSLAAVGVNAQVEGADAAAASATATVMRSNTTQILEKTVKVAGTADVTSAYGRAKESAYQMGLRAAEVKRDLEYALVGVDQAAVVGTSSVARKMASATQQIAAGNTVAGGTAALTETMVLSGLRALYTAGGEASILMIKPSDSEIVAGFTRSTGRTQRFDGSADKKVVNAVDVYVSPYDEVKVVLNRFQLTDHAFLYDPSYWRLLVLRNWFRETLAKTGDSLNMMIVGEFSLAHKNFSASAMINALT